MPEENGPNPSPDDEGEPHPSLGLVLAHQLAMTEAFLGRHRCVELEHCFLAARRAGCHTEVTDRA